MKINYMLKSFALMVLMMLLATNANAAEFNVANGATDTELAAVLGQASTGDVININGIITLKAQVHIEKNVTIRGVGNAFFDGGGANRLFEIHPEVIDGAKLVFENLGFTGGNGWAETETKDGGLARIYSGSTEFVDCWFDGNEARRGGAFMITEPNTRVAFKNCEATNNIAYGDGGESRGGYIFVDGEGIQLDHEYCTITGNKAIGGRGGAFCLFGEGTRRFYYCVIADNWGGNWGPDPSGITTDNVKLDYAGNAVSEGEYEGGVAFITGGATIFESCGIVANKSWSHGGIIRGWGDNPTSVTFVNTTLARNQSLHDRSPLWIGGYSTYTFVNSFLVDNLGQNQGNGAGFDFDGSNVKLNIFNSVFARNVAGTDGAVDIRNGVNYANQLVVKNSLIGLIQGNASGVVPQDNAGIPTKSNIAMYKLADEQAALDYAALENSGIDFGQGVRYSKVFGMPYYLLTAGSTVTKLGDPALLANYDVDSDLFNRARPIAADGSITAAPTLANTPDDYDDTRTSILFPKQDNQLGVKLINNLVVNGFLGVDFGVHRGLAKGELYSITGQKIETIFSNYVVSKGYYDVKTTTPGVYILQISIEGKTVSQRLVIQ